MNMQSKRAVMHSGDVCVMNCSKLCINASFNIFDSAKGDIFMIHHLKCRLLRIILRKICVCYV